MTVIQVELIVDSTGPRTIAEREGRDPDDSLFEDYEATYMLRAIDASGEIKHIAIETIKTPQASTSDTARLVAILTALSRLKKKLNGQAAPYNLLIKQSSRNIDGWMTQNWKRNTPAVLKFTEDVEEALRQFPKVDWVKEAKTIIEQLFQEAEVSPTK